MPRLIKPPADYTYAHDIQRIVEVCAARGYTIDPDTAYWAWREESEMLCAGWLFLPDNDAELFLDVKRRCLEVADD